MSAAASRFRKRGVVIKKSKIREMRWSQEKAFDGFACSECGWIFPNPKRSDANTLEELLTEAKVAFEYSRATKRQT